jgi:hypothetical protein
VNLAAIAVAVAVVAVPNVTNRLVDCRFVIKGATRCGRLNGFKAVWPGPLC